MHHLYDALPLPHVPVRITRSALASHRYSYVSRCKISQYRKTFIPGLSISVERS